MSPFHSLQDQINGDGKNINKMIFAFLLHMGVYVLRCNDLYVFWNIMLAGVLIAAKIRKKNIGEKFFDLSPAVFLLKLILSFTHPIKKHIRVFFFKIFKI